MRFESLRPDYEMESDIEVYNQQIEEFSRYIEISFLLINNGYHPYSNIDIYISTQLKEHFKMIYKMEVKVPMKPDPFDEISDNEASFIVSEELEVETQEITKQEIIRNGMDYKWNFGYYINKIKHNEKIILPYPLMIWIPEKSKLKKINFKIRFTHDEPVKIKEQKLEINLN